jgi:hypothetical protein
LDDGEAETESTGVAATRIFWSEEGVAEAWEEMFWDAWAVVLDGEDDAALGAGGGDLDGGGLTGVADGISEDVGDGASGESGVGFDGEVFWDGEGHGGVGAFLIASGGDELVEREGFDVDLGAETCAGEGEEFFDEAGHGGGFFTDVVDFALEFWSGALFEDAEGPFDSCEGRVEFVCDVAEEPFLAGDEFLESVCELVEGIGEAAEFFGAAGLVLGFEVAAGDVFCEAPDLAEWDCDFSDEGDPEEGGGEEDGESDPERGEFDEESADAERGGGEDEGGWAAVGVAFFCAGEACADPVETVCAEGEVAWGWAIWGEGAVGWWFVGAWGGFTDFVDDGGREGGEGSGLDGAVVSAEGGLGVVGGGDALEGIVPEVAWQGTDFVGAFDGESADAVSGFAFEECAEDGLDFGSEDEECGGGEKECVEDEPPDDLGADGEGEEAAFRVGRWSGVRGHRDR